MTYPLRKERIEDEQLTTEDIARHSQPRGPEAVKPVQSETSSPEKRKITSLSERDSFAQPSRGPELGSSPRPEAASSAPRGTEPLGEEATPLFTNNESEEFRTRWNSIQASFVDEPRKAVEQADGLVA